MSGTGPDVAIVLPPRESFSISGSGAVALLVHSVTRGPSRYRRLVVGAPCREPFADVAFRPAPYRFAIGGRARRYAAAVARAIGAPPLVEVHNRAEVALALARLRPQSRVTLFLHNDPQTMRGLRTPGEREAATRQLAGIVCVSRYLADRVTQGAPRARANVQPNAIDLAALPPRVGERNRLILFAGRLVADKGADSFVAACAIALPQLPGWHAEMIGADRFSADSPITPFVKALLPRAARAGVAMAGYQPFATVMAAMARAAIVVVPSRWQEPFGMTALEAMANGAALVCSGRGGLAEVAGDVALPCDPDDAASIAAAIIRLAGDPDERARRGAAGQTRAAMFDLRIAAAALDAYRDGLMRD
jgi:glycosyltransferase involved in cell wall biosynthesis